MSMLKTAQWKKLSWYIMACSFERCSCVIRTSSLKRKQGSNKCEWAVFRKRCRQPKLSFCFRYMHICNHMRSLYSYT